VARDRINEISQELLGLYDKFGNYISQSYYLMTPEQLEQLEGALADQGSGWTETDEEGNVQAQGMTFSIICQELVKGLVAKYTNHQFDDQSRQERGLEPLSEEESRTILNNADKLNYEPLQIQFGTELWRKFLTASAGEGVDKIDVISYVSSGPTGELNDSMNQVTEDPEIAQEHLSNLQTEITDMNFGYTEEEGEEPGDEEEEGVNFDQWFGMDAKDELDDLSIGPKDPKDIPKEEMGGDAPDDWDAIQRELFGDPAPPQDRPFGDVNQGLPPVEFDDDDDDDRPFWLGN
jgi:hypothetical protein